MKLEIDKKLTLIFALIILMAYFVLLDSNETAFRVSVMGCYSPEGLGQTGT